MAQPNRLPAGTLATDPDPDPADGPTGRPYVLEESVGHLLRRAHQRHAALFQERIGPALLTPPQFAALTRLAALGQATQNALGRAVAMDPATTQGVVQRLSARGLVRSCRDPMDRRTLVLSVTGEGELVLAEASARARAANERLLTDLAPAERTALLALLRRLAP